MSWRFRGECLFQMGRYLEAAESFREAGERGGPGVEEMFLWRALSLHNGGRTEEAKAVLRSFLEHDGDRRPELVPKVRAALGKLEGRA
jgi:hypothetical protein